jgi:hypothetical protein
LDSLFEHDPDSSIFVLCLDSETKKYLERHKYLTVNIVALECLEDVMPNLLNAKANRTTIEYFWTLTPCILYYILFIKKNCSCLTYLDADQIFYSSPAPIFNERNEADITIMPHRFPSEIKYLENHGKFNVSWLTFNNSENSMNCLKWWMNSCINWCYSKVEGEKYGDQKYLNQFKEKFKKVHVIENKSCGVAPWNFSEFDYSKKIILLHYQSLRRLSKSTFLISIPIMYKVNLRFIRPYFSILLRKLKHNSQELSFLESDKSHTQNSDSLIIFQIFNRPFFIKNHFLVQVIFAFHSTFRRQNSKML